MRGSPHLLSRPSVGIVGARNAILEGLGPEGADIDEVIRWYGMPASTVLAAIHEL